MVELRENKKQSEQQILKETHSKSHTQSDDRIQNRIKIVNRVKTETII